MRPATQLRTLFYSQRPVFIRARLVRAFSMASITVHNSLKPGGPVPFVPKEEGKISWYACGKDTLLSRPFQQWGVLTDSARPDCL